MKPTLRDVLLLLALQVGIASVAAAILALLPIGGGSQSWVGGVAVLVASQSFALIKERKRPGTVAAAGYAHRLALGATLGQLVLAGLFIGLASLVSYDEMQVTGAQLGGWLVVIAAVALLLCYGLTRWGLALGLRNLARAKAVAASKTSPPAPRAD